MTKWTPSEQAIVNHYEDRIKRLERELADARFIIISTVESEEHQRLLHGWDYKFETFRDLMEWRRDIIAKINESTKPDEKAFSRYFHEKRAPCPLCKSRGASQSFGNDGYKLPDGLARHLDGYGNVHACDTVEAAFKSLRESNRSKFAAAEKVEADHLAHRLATEPVLRTNPTGKPDLFEKTPSWNGQSRSPDQIADAEAKLEKVGFKKQVDGNVISYCLMKGDDWMVLADPREQGKMLFHVYKRSGKKSWNGLKKYPYSFDVRDNRKEWAAVFTEGLNAFTTRAK